MTHLLLLVEGQAEEGFVKLSLGPHLASHGVHTTPIVIKTSRPASGGAQRGGVGNWATIKTNQRPMMGNKNQWVSTIIDFYGLPADFPGLQETLAASKSPREAAAALQDRFHAEMKAETKHEKFIPFLALHEFEAWLFCSPDVVAEHFFGSGGKRDNMAGAMYRVLEEAGEPELIDQGKDTHPKARLKAAIAKAKAQGPEYNTKTDGPTLAQKTGIENIRRKCQHFNAWLERLEGLGGQT